jgi:hypothetical protein
VAGAGCAGDVGDRMSIDFYLDITRWALPFYFDYNRAVVYVNILCFGITVWLPAFHKTFPEMTPEEQLKELDREANEFLQYIAEERERLHGLLGINTR